MSHIGALGGIAGGVVAIIAGVLLIAFFATGDERLGRANDAALAVTAILLVPFALALNDRFEGVGALVPALTMFGLAALAVTAVASALTAAGRLSVQQLFIWQGGGFVALYVWMVGFSVGSLVYGRSAPLVAWVGIGAAGLLVVAFASMWQVASRSGGWAALGDMRTPPVLAMLAMTGALLGLPIWCIALGMELLTAG